MTAEFVIDSVAFSRMALDLNDLHSQLSRLQWQLRLSHTASFDWLCANIVPSAGQCEYGTWAPMLVWLCGDDGQEYVTSPSTRYLSADEALADALNVWRFMGQWLSDLPDAERADVVHRESTLAANWAPTMSGDLPETLAELEALLAAGCPINRCLRVGAEAVLP